MTSVRPLEELLFYMRPLSRQTVNEWEAGFARSVLRQAKNPNWHPSEKQLQIMQRMVSDMFPRQCPQSEEEFDLIDKGDRHDAA